jgi:hypothetical protein
MANWLQKITEGGKKQNLPTLSTPQPPKGAPKKLPNASIIYGLAAGLFGAGSIYFLFTGAWFTGFMVLFLAACFLGYAVHFLKNG